MRSAVKDRSSLLDIVSRGFCGSDVREWGLDRRFAEGEACFGGGEVGLWELFDFESAD